LKDNRRRTDRHEKPSAPTSWDAVARWYDGWVGQEGSEHHREVAVPALVELLEPRPGESILDIGAGQGVLAPHIIQAGARYTGVDASPRLVQIARKRHGRAGPGAAPRFLLGDARELRAVPGLSEGEFDAVAFLLSIQDMDQMERVLESAAWALKPGGRVAMVLTHPAFRVPRQSGWGWDEGRRLHYRRVDHYLTPLRVPMKTLPGKEGKVVTRSFHRPVGAYINALAACGLLVDRMSEIPGHKANAPPERERAAEQARREIPLFLGLRARKVV
jgi:ubiquinone/menaquinone biosynthesis C-methylase UbiE